MMVKPAPHTKLLTLPKVEDIVGLYLDPPEKALVLSIDEKSQMAAPGR